MSFAGWAGNGLIALSWEQNELATLDFGHKRRNDRAIYILEHLVKCPDSTPQAFADNAALEATYRFANSEHTAPEVIMSAHRDATLRRIQDGDTVATIQDTTVIDLTKPTLQVSGAGVLETNSKRGYFWHPLYAVRENGIPLGIVDQVQWIREKIEKDKTSKQRAKDRRVTDFSLKESSRWLEMFQSSEQLAMLHPNTQFVHIADSECDIHEIYLEKEGQAPNHHFIIRGASDREVVSDESDEPQKLSTLLSKLSVLYEEVVDVGDREALISGETRARRQARPARQAVVSVRAKTITLQGPRRPGERLPDVELNVVEAVELSPPEDEEAIRWVLITSLPIDELHEIRRIIELYKKRWQVEVLFKTLKSGMRIEKLKYESLPALQTIAALMYIAAFRVEELKMAARVAPEAPCSEYVSAAEWKALYMVRKKTRKLPDKPPTMAEFILMVAQAGGYSHRPGRSPGSETLWRGLQKMEAYRDVYLTIFNE